RMLTTSIPVHDPSARRRISAGDAAADRSGSVSNITACPEGVVPTNISSPAYRTTAFVVLTIALQLRAKNNTANQSQYFVIQRCSDCDLNPDFATKRNMLRLHRL